jgi:hypothetical protein
MTAVHCVLCDRNVPRWGASMVHYPIAHVSPTGAPCPRMGRWSRRRIGECREWQASNLIALVDYLDAFDTEAPCIR